MSERRAIISAWQSFSARPRSLMYSPLMHLVPVETQMTCASFTSVPVGGVITQRHPGVSHVSTHTKYCSLTKKADCCEERGRPPKQVSIMESPVGSFQSASFLLSSAAHSGTHIRTHLCPVTRSCFASNNKTLG